MIFVVAVLTFIFGLLVGWLLGITFAARHIVEAARRSKKLGSDLFGEVGE